MNVLIAKNREECGVWTETAVVVDVLRSSATICELLKRGRKQLLVFGDAKQAIAFKKQSPEYEVFSELALGVEQTDNSPYLAAKSDASKPALIVTNAGTKAILSLKDASNIFVGGFCNFSAVVRLLNSQQQDVLLVPSCLFGNIDDVEDIFCAEAMKDFIQGFDSLFEKMEEFKVTFRYGEFLKGPKTAKEDMKMAFDINATPFVPSVSLIAGTGYGVCTKFDRIVPKKEVSAAFDKPADIGGTLTAIGSVIEKPLSPEDTILINETKLAQEKNALQGFFQRLVTKKNKGEEEDVLQLSEEELAPEHAVGRMDSIDEVPLYDLQPGIGAVEAEAEQAEEEPFPAAQPVVRKRPAAVQAQDQEVFVADVEPQDEPLQPESAPSPSVSQAQQSPEPGKQVPAEKKKSGLLRKLTGAFLKEEKEDDSLKPKIEERKKRVVDGEPELNLELTQSGMQSPSPEPESEKEDTFDVVEAALRRDVVFDHSPASESSKEQTMRPVPEPVETREDSLPPAEPHTITPSEDTLPLQRTQRFAPEPEPKEPIDSSEPVEAAPKAPAAPVVKKPLPTQKPAQAATPSPSSERTSTSVREALKTQAFAAPSGKKAIVLFSGGLDSTTCLYWALSKGYTCEALTISYGQKHAREIQSAQAIAKRAGVKLHHLTFNFPWLAASNSLMDENQDIPDQSLEEIEKGGIPSTYVPGRNLVFLSVAASLLDSVGADAIVAGPNAVDFSGYPDCTPDFFKAAAAAINRGTRQGVTKGVQVMAPLMKFRKSDIVRLAKKLRVPLELTWSCYAGGEKPCGTCDSCKLRAKGFEEAGIKDDALH